MSDDRLSPDNKEPLDVPPPMTRYDAMVEMQVWTNRLERVLQSRLNELKTGLNKCITNIGAVLASLPEQSEQAVTLRELRGYCESLLKNVYVELIEMYVHAADNTFARNSQLIELREKLRGLQKECETLRERDRQGLRRRLFDAVKRRAASFFPPPSLEAAEKREQEEKQAVSPALVLNNDQVYESLRGVDFCNYETVDNTGTPLEIFDAWQTVFHYDGRRYGSKHPILTDHLEHIVDLHRVLYLKGKKVLELGPFEGANTKQLADLGVGEVVAIEANKDFYLKCLVVKNQFRLDQVELIYGNCLEVLAQPRFRSNPWFDLCYASGILYHMKDPLYFLDLITGTAPNIFIWSQYASEIYPRGEWTDLHDAENRAYRARWNSYRTEKHWGGVAEGAYWLTKESMIQAFADRGFEATRVETGQNGSGMWISFLARRPDVAQAAVV